MPQRPWSPLRVVCRDLEQQVEELFSDLIDAPWKGELHEWRPQIDVYENDDAYEIDADLPGVRPQDLSLRIEPHRVVICGERIASTTDRSGQSVRIERRHGRFCREFPLRTPVDETGLTVQHAEGVFHIRIPKRTPSREPPPA